jgi:hypothetical protein
LCRRLTAEWRLICKKLIFFGQGLTRAGESFPDVGILENLAAVLDIRIQDIVTGDTEVNNDGVVDEVLRIAKL